MGYEGFVHEKDNGLSASAIFYKKDKFQCTSRGHINLDYGPSKTNQGEFEISNNENKDGAYHLIYCKLIVSDPSAVGSTPRKEFIFAETHLKAMDNYRKTRAAQANKVTQFFQENFVGIPLLLAGDFNDFPHTDPLNTFE